MGFDKTLAKVSIFKVIKLSTFKLSSYIISAKFFYLNKRKKPLQKGFMEINSWAIFFCIEGNTTCYRKPFDFQRNDTETGYNS